MNEILVIGHRNPDTDSICAALGYAAFKNAIGVENVIAARCGDTNARIDFVLKTFDIAPPKFVADVSPTVADVMHEKVHSVKTDSTAAEALRLMEDQNLRILPVLDDDRHCRGLVSLFKLGKYLFPSVNGDGNSRIVLSSLKNLAATLNGTIIVGVDIEQEDELTLMIGAMGLESFASRLEQTSPQQWAVVVGDRWDIQNIAIREGVRVIIVTGDQPIEPKTIEAAQRNNVSIIASPHDTVTTASLCRAAVAIRHVLTDKFLSFHPQEQLRTLRNRAVASGHQVFPILNDDNNMVGIMTKTDLLKSASRKIILVDHNELSQAVPGADEVEILEIIDHHRIGTMSTQHPILFRNEVVGSTSTIVAECFMKSGLEIPTPIAGLLLAGLASDTLNLTSPTTTQRDIEVLAHLEQVAGINAKEFTEQLFSIGSLLTLNTATAAISTDCKEYVENGARFSVAQIEETGYVQFWKRKDEVKIALAEYRHKKKYDFSALLITDVTSQESLLLLDGSLEFVAMINYPQIEPGIYQLSNVVSRKKQLLPYLAHRLRDR